MFKLEHPFDRTVTANSFAEGDLRDNLMEYYGGTSLVKQQWDAIHKPGTVIGIFERDEDAMALSDDKHGVRYYLEMIRWANAFGQSAPTNLSSAPSVKKNLKLNHNIIVEGKITVLALPSTYNASYSEKTITKDALMSGKAVSVIKFINKGHASSFLEIRLDLEKDVNLVNSYLFPTKDEWLRSVDDLIVSAKVGDYSEMLDILGVYRFDALKELDLYQRIEILKLLVKHNKLKGNVLSGGTGETLAVNIIGSTPSNQLVLLFEALQKDNLMQKLCSEIDNWGGKDNYTSFISALTQKFIEYKKDDLKNIVKTDQDLQRYINSQAAAGKNVYFVWNKTNREDKYGSYANIWYKKEYKNNNLYFTNGTGFSWGILQESGQRKYEYPALDPFDIIAVYFSSIPNSFPIPEKSIMLIPTFLFEWICNDHNNQQVVKYIDWSVTAASCIAAVGWGNRAVRILFYIKAIVTIGDVALLNTSFREFVKNNSPDYVNILQTWDYMSKVLTAESLSEDLLLIGVTSLTSISFNALFNAWNIYKTTDDYKNLQQGNKEMITQIDALLQLLKDSENE